MKSFLITSACLLSFLSAVSLPESVLAQVAPPAKIVTPSNLALKVSLDGQFCKISEAMTLIEANTKVLLSLASSTPDVEVFVSCKKELLKDVLKQLRFLMTDKYWKYNWAEYHLPSGDSSYRFWRVPIDEAQRKRIQQAQLRSRMKSLLDAIQGGESSLDKLAESEPIMGSNLKYPLFSSRLKLLNSLSDEQLDQVMNGQPLRFGMDQLTPEQRQLGLNLTGGNSSLEIVDGNGKVVSQHNQDDFAKRATISFKLMTPDGDPSAISINVRLEYDAGQAGVSCGGDALYPTDAPYWQPVKDALAEKQKILRRDTLRTCYELVM